MKNLCLFVKKKAFLKYFPYPKLLLFFRFLTIFFLEVSFFLYFSKTKITSYQILYFSSWFQQSNFFVTIIATITQVVYKQIFKWNVKVARVVIFADLWNQCNRCFYPEWKPTLHCLSHRTYVPFIIWHIWLKKLRRQKIVNILLVCSLFKVETFCIW